MGTRRDNVSRIMVAAAVGAVTMGTLTTLAGHALAAPRQAETRREAVQVPKKMLYAPAAGMQLKQNADGNYIVEAGDTLAGIAWKEMGSADCWPAIWHANSGQVANPDLIYPGQGLAIPASCNGGGGIQEAAVTQASSSQSQGYSAPPAAGSGGYAVTSSFQQCVIDRESGGNAQIWNSSGYYGLYQFGYSTWVAAGGAPGLFGHADGAYQTQVFWRAYSLWGTSPWEPSDGCSL